MNGGKWMVREYRAGAVCERSKFWVPEQTKVRRGRKAASTQRKRDQNEKDGIKRLARIINANYKPGDLWITLTYGDASTGAGAGVRARLECALSDVSKAEAEAKLFIRRLVRRLQMPGIGCRSLLITSDMDEQSRSTVRVHHHVLLPSEALPFVRELWPYGIVDIKTLREQPDYTPLAVYLIRQVRYKPDAKKWSASRNMLKPIITEREVSGGEEVAPPRGAMVLARGEYDAMRGESYVRYIRKCDLPEGREEKRKGGGAWRRDSAG